MTRAVLDNPSRPTNSRFFGHRLCIFEQMSRQTPFNESHHILYGVKPIERSLYVAISVVRCQFCVHLGREKREGPVVKRQRTKNIQLFKFPFRAESYKNQLESQHTDDWKKYQLLAEEKRSFSRRWMLLAFVRMWRPTETYCGYGPDITGHFVHLLATPIFTDSKLGAQLHALIVDAGVSKSLKTTGIQFHHHRSRITPGDRYDVLSQVISSFQVSMLPALDV
jgi:hypothetical protein